ncbi:MAG: hypothetical protein ACFFDY_01080 [Candidatus Thorarchaeota archaeon]
MADKYNSLIDAALGTIEKINQAAQIMELLRNNEGTTQDLINELWSLAVELKEDLEPWHSPIN